MRPPVRGAGALASASGGRLRSAGMARLGADAARVVEQAHAVARRHRHAEVEPEHLLRVLAAEPDAAAVFTRLAIESVTLAEQLDAHLSTWPASGLYRDARVEPQQSERLRILFRRAGWSSIFSFVRPLTLEQLTLATCGLPSVAPLVLDARAESITAQDVVAHARILAAGRGDDALSVFHVVHVVADQPWMASALRDAGIDRTKLQSALESRLERTTKRPIRLGLPFAAIGNRNVWLGALLRSPSVVSVFSDDVGVPVQAVFRALARGSGAPDDDTFPSGDGSDGAQIEIVFHNDDFTTMPFVVDTLVHAFALSTADAVARMRGVHEHGQMVVATLPARDARKALKNARSHARREQMPLRITWRRASPAEPRTENPEGPAELDPSDS